MTNSGRLRGSASIQHPLGRDGSIPKRIAEDRLLYLTQAIRAGTITKDEQDELGRGFIRLAIKMSTNYSCHRPEKADDYASAALFGIAYALDKAKEKLVDDNVTPWVIANIKRFLRKFYETDHMIHTPKTTYKRAKDEGREIAETTVVMMTDEELNSTGNKKNGLSRKQLKNYRATGQVYELREILQLSAKDDYDRSIIQMRSAGYTDKEIAERLELSAGYIQQKRAAIETRFDELSRDED